mmetsp:Transcript_701/g.1252  ORF Transcript_701/g.1252 Transcript_701/m.1252 type:complete len:294 (-) Transcript_701:130-1011(-)
MSEPAVLSLEEIWDFWPGTARWCMRFTLAQVLLSIFAHLFWAVGPLYEGDNEAERELFGITRWVLLIPLGLVTLFHLVEYVKHSPRPKALIISRVCMFEFSVKVLYYTFMNKSRGPVYQNMRCWDTRPIYAARWYGWTFAIPTLIFMNLFPILDDRPLYKAVLRIFPQQACTAGYCWACYIGCIVTDPWMGWLLNILACVAYVAVIVDEVVLVAERILHTAQPILKGYSIIIKECVFVIYTCVWLMGNCSYTSSYACQRFYCVSDVSLKATMSTLLFVYWSMEGSVEEEKKTT